MIHAEELRNTYAEKALSQIPRILGNMDRNPFSPTYGCMHRDYWFYKTSDFSDAIRQFAVHALTLIYKHEFPGNIYFGNKKIRDWAVAGLEFLTKIQHGDGSFDEFYPYERGWGQSAFVTYTSIESLRLLKDEISKDIYNKILNTIRKSAYFIASWKSERDQLANHHAIACLAVWKAYELLDDLKLKDRYKRMWEGFIRLQTEEGWSIEYDGIDPGYLSATVSSLAKIYQTNPDPEILEVLRKSVEMCSYFVYPNGFYGGSIGSRNTMHFYPHGFELMAVEIPLAGAIAEKMLKALSENKLVPPEIISDRYLVFRVPEFLLAYIDYAPRLSSPPELPYQRKPFTTFFSRSKIYVKNTDAYYAVANLAKGGVMKVFDKTKGGKLVFNDCGWIGNLENGKVFTNQWISDDFRISTRSNGWEVKGKFGWVSSNEVFTLTKNLIFRFILLLVGWSPRISHILKDQIRKKLVLGQRPAPISSERTVFFNDKKIEVNDNITIEQSSKIKSLSVGDEFSVRYVPQSRYFQSQELEISGKVLTSDELIELNNTKRKKLTRVISFN